MRVLGFAGSPRVGGNSELLLDEALRGATDAGAETVRIRLADAGIGPCDACAVCKKTGECVNDDGLAALREEMERADVCLFSTPIYFWGPSAQLKAFVDRWYSFQVKGQGFMRGKRAGLICTFNAKTPETARHTVGMFEDALRYMGVGFDHRLLVSAAGLGEVAGDADALAQAYRLGGELAKG